MKADHLALALIRLSRETSPAVAAEKFALFAKKHDFWQMYPAILAALEKRSKMQDSAQILSISSSHPLDAASEKKISTLVCGKANPPIVAMVDKSLIGGFVAEYGNQIYDASVKNVLRRLKRNLLEANNV